MGIGRWIATGVVAAAIAAVATLYASLLWDGTLPPPNAGRIAEAIQTSANGGTHFVTFAALAILGLLAAIAPVLYAARSHDLLTLLISVAMTGAAIVVLFTGKSAFDQIMAMMIYLANIILSTGVYAAHKITSH